MTHDPKHHHRYSTSLKSYNYFQLGSSRPCTRTNHGQSYRV